MEFGKPAWIDIGSLSLKRSALKAATDSPGIAYKLLLQAEPDTADPNVPRAAARNAPC
jgi:hypothetical protein